MAAYSLDLRTRVLRAWDRGMGAAAVAATYDVSRAWVHRLVQRRRSAATSGRRCSSACTVFFDREIQAVNRAPQRAQRRRGRQLLA